MPEVSVVVPTYDRADVLPRAMDSVLEQSYDDLELIVVDDGSTDDTESVVAAYDDPRIQYVAHGTNRGANPARNTGIEAAEGRYVAFLDSDDEWRPTKLAAQVDRLGAGDWVAAYCGFETDPGGTSASVQSTAARLLALADENRPAEGGIELVDEILTDDLHPAAGSTLIVRSDVARAIGGFDEELDRFQDPDFVIRILDEGRLAYVDDPLVVRHDTGSPPADDVRDAAEEFLAKHADAVARAEARGRDVAGAYDLVLAKSYLAEGHPATGARLLRDAAATPRHVPGLLWAAGAGARRRTDRTALGVAALALLLLGVARSRR